MNDPHRLAVEVEAAVTALMHRAKLAGIPNAEDWAREYVDALRHRGWRPWAVPTVLPRDHTRPADPARVADLAADARAVIRATRQTQPAEESE
jgi:hypothetical protein